MILAGFLGAVIGVILGLTGAGGGILAVPALVLGLGFSMTQATPVALIAVGFAALLGALDGLRKGLVRYKAAVLMALLGSLISPLGVIAAHKLSNAWLMTIFSGVMLLVAYRMYAQSRVRGGTDSDFADQDKRCMLSPATGRFIWTTKSASTLATIGATSGLFTGMLGVGGGFIIVPALRHFSNVTMHGIVATSLMVIALVSATTVAHSLISGVEFPTIAWAFVGCTMLGMAGGRLASSRVPTRFLQVAFAAIAALVAILLLAKTYFPAAL
jgi:uncharacterized membrane protein YfcA